MSEQWDAYRANVDGLRSAILVDLSLLPNIPDPAKPILLRLSHNLRMPRPDGLADDCEHKALLQIHRRLTDVLGRLLSATVAGVVTRNSRQEYYFYVSDTVDMPAIDYAGQNAMQIFPGYVHEIELRKDSDWAFYRDFLYPRAIARQYRENRRLLEELKESGDILSAERPIYHFAAFKSDGERKTFIDDVLKHGFSLADNGLGTSDYTDRPYSVEIQRTDTTQLERIDEVTTQIISLARSHDGKYDGWETSVVLRISKKF